MCIAGEHKWEASVAKYIKMASFPPFDSAILLGTSQTVVFPSVRNDLRSRFLTSALKSNSNSGSLDTHTQWGSMQLCKDEGTHTKKYQVWGQGEE